MDSSPFKKLPLELRTMIYEYAFTKDSSETIATASQQELHYPWISLSRHLAHCSTSPVTQSTVSLLAPEPMISRTCKEMREEVLDAYYSQPFSAELSSGYAEIYERLRMTLTQRNEKSLQRIKTLTIVFHIRTSLDLRFSDPIFEHLADHLFAAGFRNDRAALTCSLSRGEIEDYGDIADKDQAPAVRRFKNKMIQAEEKAIDKAKLKLAAEKGEKDDPQDGTVF